jgi:hypothetical protein
VQQQNGSKPAFTQKPGAQNPSGGSNPTGSNIVISSGGTYTGLIVRGTISAPAVRITTASPVTIKNSTIYFSSADGIQDYVTNGQVTLTNCQFYGQNPNVSGKLAQCAVDTGSGHYGVGLSLLNVNHCTIVNSGNTAILVAGANPGATIQVNNNWFVNLQGSPSNGNGGWNTAGWTGAHTHAIQIGGSSGLNCQIEWNYVRNTPFESSCDDVFSFYDAQGTASNWIQCCNNFLDGMYTGLVSSQHEDGAGFTTDGNGSDPECAYILFQNDYSVNISGKGMQLPAGHDITFDHFYTYSNGYAPDGSGAPLWSYNAGIIAGPGSGIYNDVVQNCFSYGLRPPKGEFDPGSSSPQVSSYNLVSGSGVAYANNTSWSASSTSAAILFEQWQSQLAQTSNTVGSTGPVIDVH